MNQCEQFELLASYNQWMNVRLYEAAGSLPLEDLAANRGAFFGSILGTLNHILVGDRIWLQRFAKQPCSESVLQTVSDLPAPLSLDQLLFEDFPQLSAQRLWLDQTICEWVACLSESDMNSVLSYRNTQGVSAHRQLSSLVLHFFNHQTHHRGQITTLLSQVGQNLGSTDLLTLIPDEGNGPTTRPSSFPTGSL